MPQTKFIGGKIQVKLSNHDYGVTRHSKDFIQIFKTCYFKELSFISINKHLQKIYSIWILKFFGSLFVFYQEIIQKHTQKLENKNWLSKSS